MTENSKTRKAIDLKPGDKFVERRLDEVHIIEVVGEQEAAPNQFGLPWFRYLCKTGDRQGYMSFGPTGTVTLAD